MQCSLLILKLVEARWRQLAIIRHRVNDIKRIPRIRRVMQRSIVGRDPR